jgi:NhaA family Na+:H+ antiporter
MARRSTLAFLQTEAGSGLLLVIAALLAIVWANSPWSHAYFTFTNHLVTVQVGGFLERMSVKDWVRHGLMAVFFFVVGLELKHEVRRGELSSPRRLVLPLLAALGGMIAPALIYLAFNAGPSGQLRGWPAPTATDVAFALAVLAVAAPRLPPTLRILLLAVAMVDDLVAVGVIAFFFSEQVNLFALGGAVSALALMALLGQWRNAPLFFYSALAVVVWAFTQRSGINTSIAGVAAAMTIPTEPRRPGRPDLTHYFMESLHPYVAFLILPLFAFVAAGFAFRDASLGAISSPVALGVALGLFLGKQAGVFGAMSLAIGLKLARRPTGARWQDLHGIALLCGVGFTMSLFIGSLALHSGDAAAQSQVRLGAVAGSLLSSLTGMAALLLGEARRRDEPA